MNIREFLRRYPSSLKVLKVDIDTSEALEKLAELGRKIEHVVELGKKLVTPEKGSRCYLVLDAGAGGINAHDWAHTLLRMYERWCERVNLKVECIMQVPGEMTGIQLATLRIDSRAYDSLKGETGVHRLVRISPFDGPKFRRWTSFVEVRVGLGSPPGEKWVDQIRSYVLDPYHMVKDHRTNRETKEVYKVLDGDLSQLAGARFV